MANFVLNNTADEINTAIGKVVSPNNDLSTSSLASTTLATSGSIKSYVDNSSITQTSGSAPYYGIRAWAYYNGTSDQLIRNGNISSVTKHNTGKYEFFFSAPMVDAGYAINFSFSGEVATWTYFGTQTRHTQGYVTAHNENSFTIEFFADDNGAAKSDKAYVGVAVIC